MLREGELTYGLINTDVLQTQNPHLEYLSKRADVAISGPIPITAVMEP